MMARESEVFANPAGGRFAPAVDTARPAVAGSVSVLSSFLARLHERLAEWGGTLSLIVPGTGQMLQGRLSHGVFFLSVTTFLAALTWAILVTAGRLATTLPLLGLSPGSMFVALGAIWILAGATHVCAVVSAMRAGAPHPPLVSALASFLVPGWGQVLNGHRIRAGLFLAATWLVTGVWIASSQSAIRLLDTYLPYVSEAEATVREPLVLWTARWTAPVLVWCLAVYDGCAAAAARSAAWRAEPALRTPSRLRAAR